jgi:hypothetical protein
LFRGSLTEPSMRHTSIDLMHLRAVFESFLLYRMKTSFRLIGPSKMVSNVPKHSSKRVTWTPNFLLISQTTW